jgi:AcrR family transcriptional regulator
MARWTAGAKERLQAAAFEAIRARGLESVTVAEIAAAAGVTERTFFRYFADKREVLFGGQEVLLATWVEHIAEAPADSDAGRVVVEAMRAAAEALFPNERRSSSRVRGEVIAGDIALQERESLKMRALSAAVAHALVERGGDEVESALAAQAVVGVFTVAFAQWIAPGESRSLAEIQDDLLVRLDALLPRS